MTQPVHGPGRLTRREVLSGAIGLAAGATLLGVAGCGGDESPGEAGAGESGEPTRGGVITLAITNTSASETLDPATVDVTSEYALFGLLYNTLTNLNYRDWSLTPGLAESWEPNADLTEWQFKLRRGVTFHDGKPLTAKDVVWTLRRILDTAVGSSAYTRAAKTMVPNGIKAVDDSTVLISLAQPDSLLPIFLARPHLSIVKEGVERFSAATSIGTGPFKLKSWEAATSWEVERNPDYWENGLPYLDGVRQVINTESAARVQGVKAGDFDLAEEVDFASAKPLEGDANVALLRFPKGICRIIIMDATVPPFTDKRVRNAFKFAMNRELAMESVYQGFASPTSDVVVPSNDPYYPPDLDVRPYDPEQAKSLLAQAGYPDGVDVELLTSQVFSAMPDLAITFSQSAKEAGIRVNVNQWAAETYWDKVWFSKPFYTSYQQSDFPPDLLWRLYTPDASYNEAKLEMPQFTELFTKILGTNDRSEQIGHTQEALALAAEEWGYVIPAVPESPWPANPKLKGVEGDPPYYRVRLTRAYLEP